MLEEWKGGGFHTFQHEARSRVLSSAISLIALHLRQSRDAQMAMTKHFYASRVWGFQSMCVCLDIFMNLLNEQLSLW